MDQLSIFDIPEEIVPEHIAPANDRLFDKEKANWREDTWVGQKSDEKRCRVIGMIPEYIKDPIESGSRNGYPTDDYGRMLDVWAAYVWAITRTIPYKERASNDPNAWSAACKLLHQARDERLEIELEVWEWNLHELPDLEVIKYL